MFDMRTIVFSYAVSNALITATMALLWYQNRKRYAGLSFWLMAYILQMCGSSLVLLRDVAPEVVSILIANTLIVAGAFVLYVGLERFVGKPRAQIHNYLILASFVGLLSYFTFVQADISMRIVVISIAILLLTAQCSVLMLRRVDSQLRPITRYVGLVFLVYALAAPIRVLLVRLDPLAPRADWFQSPVEQALVILVIQMLGIALTFALILMVTRRLRFDVQTQELHQQKALREYNEHLERQVKQRTLALEQEVAQRKVAEQALRASAEEYRRLFTEMIDGFALHEILCDSAGNAVDYVTLQVNAAFGSLLNVPRETVIGKKASEILPRAELDHWLEIFGPVARTGQSAHYEMYSALNQKHFEGSAYCPEKGRFAVVFADITERKRAEEQLRVALEEKTALLREAHHRVKNNLQAMIALMQLRGAKIADPPARRLLAQLAEQARTMSLVYEQLHQTGNLAQVKMQAYLERLAAHVLQAFSSSRDVVLRVDAGDTLLDARWAMPCGLIVNELVTNALKHAFPPDFTGRPAICVALRQEQAQHVLQVTDNGMGLPASVNWQNPSTLGLELINLWATHQMGGTLRVDSTQGAAYTITFEARSERS